MPEVYRKPCYFVKRYAVCSQTLSRWARQGKIKYIQTAESGKKRYLQTDVLRALGVSDNPQQEKEETKINVLYARVSSAKQKGDLYRQIQDLQELYQTKHPTHQENKDYVLFKDVASGVNFKRPGLHSLLDLVHAGNVSTVAVMHKDRLTRLGGDLLDWFFKKNNARVVVYGHKDGKEDQGRQEEAEQDLASDLLTVTTVLVASYNGKRAAQNRKRRTEQQYETRGKNKKRRTIEGQKVQILPSQAEGNGKPCGIPQEKVSVEKETQALD
jgi:predicted site-specific integrase-resolvase